MLGLSLQVPSAKGTPGDVSGGEGGKLTSSPCGSAEFRKKLKSQRRCPQKEVIPVSQHSDSVL